MKGIQFLTDDAGVKSAVQIDLRQYGELWEDIYDVIRVRQRKNDPRESLESVRKRLRIPGQ